MIVQIVSSVCCHQKYVLLAMPVVHQDYVNKNVSASNFLIMNRYTDSYIEKDNQITIGKLTNKTVYTLKNMPRMKISQKHF